MHPFVRTAITALLMIVPAAAIASSDIAMHRDPGCGCCEKWAAQVRQQFHRKVQIIDDADRLVVYESDALNAHREIPWIVVLPDSISQVQEIMKLCSEYFCTYVVRNSIV